PRGQNSRQASIKRAAELRLPSSRPTPKLSKQWMDRGMLKFSRGRRDLAGRSTRSSTDTQYGVGLMMRMLILIGETGGNSVEDANKTEMREPTPGDEAHYSER
ncbi:hypothetical protein, partial [Bradyrhizobium sp. CCBAU 45394]|uniref:hypothetical protein n=1 Tax=Bradyrhizobium sp. CCBAU 45394 TaxID=1325087 RepID=UPI0023029CCE